MKESLPTQKRFTIRVKGVVAMMLKPKALAQTALMSMSTLIVIVIFNSRNQNEVRPNTDPLLAFMILIILAIVIGWVTREK